MPNAIARSATAAALAATILATPAPALAHGGGLAADGCHMDRRTGQRHCHRGPNAGATTVRTPDGGRTVYYPNCAAARAAGAAPVLRGEPGYGAHLDRDGDGRGCE
jgi:hypothetical protein